MDTERVEINAEPYAATWLQRQRRTDRVRLVANPTYWNKVRGPRLSEVVFRNDLSLDRALELVGTTEGEVDLVTEVPAAQAGQVERSRHARLVAIDALRVVAGAFNRADSALPLGDLRARQALNLAVDRTALVRTAMHGRARPLSGLTPPVPLTAGQRAPDRLSPYPHDPERAARLWREAPGPGSRTLRIATLTEWAQLTGQLAEQLSSVLGLQVEVDVLDPEQTRAARRRLAAKDGPQGWDILVLDHGVQSGDAPPLELHRAFVATTGEFRAGPVLPEFETVYDAMVRRTGPARQAMAANRVDRYVTRQALALFLVAPQALYAVNRHVDFTPYRTTFELAETSVRPEHWSRRRS